MNRSHYDTVVEGLSGAVGAQKIGPGLHADATMGPLNSAQQRDYVQGLLDEVRADAEVRELAEPVDERAFARGQFMRPSLVLDPRQDARIVTEDLRPGQTVDLQVLRGGKGKPRVLRVRLAERPSSPNVRFLPHSRPGVPHQSAHMQRQSGPSGTLSCEPSLRRMTAR